MDLIARRMVPRHQRSRPNRQFLIRLRGPQPKYLAHHLAPAVLKEKHRPSSNSVHSNSRTDRSGMHTENTTTNFGDQMRPETRSFDSRRKGALLCCLLTLAVLGAWLALPTCANAGPARYIYEVCDSAIPGGNTSGATFSGDTRYVSPSNDCAQPFGSLGIYAFSSLSK